MKINIIIDGYERIMRLYQPLNRSAIEAVLDHLNYAV